MIEIQTNRQKGDATMTTIWVVVAIIAIGLIVYFGFYRSSSSTTSPTANGAVTEY